ncbi:MAG: ABC transporter substrate-binding protein [Clostridia bacterium]|nr:ABC transporter substrate-binding protein [Clostridia bacterium]
MRYHIDTIPIWDAFKSGSECPLCTIYKKIEADFIDSALGGSVMEPDTRIEVNKAGFCNEHLSMLYGMQNRLGLALMAHSHLKEIIKELNENSKKVIDQAEIDEKKSIAVRSAQAVSKSYPYLKETEKLSQSAHNRQSDCFICNRIENSMVRYLETICAMWEDDPEFRKLFAASKGFCLDHYSRLLDTARRKMFGKPQREFIKELIRIEEENLDRIEKDLEWFTLKFDYRNRDKPWGESRDAVERTLLKLRGWTPPAEKK